MTDFGFEALFSAKESISDALENIRDSLNETAASSEATEDALDDAGDAMNNVAGDAKVAESAVADFDNESEDLARTLERLQVTGAGAFTSLKTLSTLDISEPGGMAEFMQGDIPGEMLGERRFTDRIAGRLDIDPPRGSMSQAQNLFRNQLSNVEHRIDSIEDLADEIQQLSMVESNEIAVLQALQGAMAQTTGVVAGYQAGVDEAENEQESLNRTLWSTVPSSLAASGSMGVLAGTLLSVEDSADDAEDKIRDLNDALNSLLPALRSVSANIGPFNVGLTNLIVTIPVILALMGPLLTLVGGLATAFLAAAGALGAFAAVGAIDFLEQLEEQFAGVTNTTEAATALMEGLAGALNEAIEPLRNVEFAGMSGIELFIRLLQNTVAIVNNVAEVFAELLGMEEVEDFFFRIEDALLGIGETSGGISMLEGLRRATEALLPPVTDFIVFVIDKFPEFLAFAARISENLIPAIEEFGTALLELTRELSIVGAEGLSIVLRGLEFLLSITADVIENIRELKAALGPLGDAFVALSVSALGLSFIVLKLAGAISTLVTVKGALATISDTAGIKVSQLATALGRLAAGVSVLVVGLFLLEDATGIVSAFISVLSVGLQILSGFIDIITGLIEGFREFTNEAGPLGDVLNFLVFTIIQGGIGVVLTFAGAQMVASAATGTLSTALASMIPSASGASISISGLTASVTALNLSLGPIIALITALTVGLGLLSGEIDVVSGSLDQLLGLVIALGAGFGALATAMGLTVNTIAVAIAFGTGLGAVLAGIAAAIILVIDNWDALVETFTSGIDWIIGKLQDLVGMFDVVADAVPDISLGGDGGSAEGALGLGVLGAAAGGVVGGIAGSVIPGAGTAAGATIGAKLGGTAGLAAGAMSFDKGGFIKDSGLAMLHSNEYVIPSDQINNMLADGNVGQMPQQTTSKTSKTNVTVNIDNSGRGSIDEREAHRIGRAVDAELANKQKRQDGQL